jgi:hypothetical protein
MQNACIATPNEMRVPREHCAFNIVYIHVHLCSGCSFTRYLLAPTQTFQTLPGQTHHKRAHNGQARTCLHSVLFRIILASPFQAWPSRKATLTCARMDPDLRQQHMTIQASPWTTQARNQKACVFCFCLNDFVGRYAECRDTLLSCEASLSALFV